jgi:hypothetical protein
MIVCMSIDVGAFFVNDSTKRETKKICKRCEAMLLGPYGYYYMSDLMKVSTVNVLNLDTSKWMRNLAP